MDSWYFWVVAIILFFAGLSAADKFAEIAEMKGHHDKCYFWWCFLFPFIGYPMVIALPKLDSEAVTEDDIPEI